MTKQENIVERLSQFNNSSFTRKQWEIILKGCGCPKSNFFWRALRDLCMCKNQKLYNLKDIDSDTYNKVETLYCKLNRASVKKAYYTDKARKKAQTKKDINITFFLIDGYLTTEKPNKENE